MERKNSGKRKQALLVENRRQITAPLEEESCHGTQMNTCLIDFHPAFFLELRGACVALCHFLPHHLRYDARREKWSKVTIVSFRGWG